MTMVWPTRALEELASVQRGKFSARPRNDPKYYGGEIPFIQTGDVANGAGRVRSYSQTLNADGLSVSRLFPRGSLVVTIAANIGDVARVEFNFACPDSLVVIQANDGIDCDWLQYSLESKKGLLDSLAPQNAQKNINLEVLRPLPLDVPPIGEQKRIAGALGTWDTAIQKTEQLIAAKEQLLAHFRDHLLREPDQASLIKLREVTHELTARNGTSLGREAIMAVTKQVGMRPMRQETIAANIERYKVVPPNAFAYNPMRLNIGSIAISPFEGNVLVSPDYVVFLCDESKLLPTYLHHVRHSHKWKSHFELAGNGSVRVRIYYDDLGRFAFWLPPIDVQAGIVKLLDTAALEITRLQQQVEALRLQKRGLMQKLLTGQWRLPLPHYTHEETVEC